MPFAAEAHTPMLGASKKDRLNFRRPHLLVASDQTGTVQTFCQLLRHLDYTVEVVFEASDALTRIMRDENRHYLLVTGCLDGTRVPTISAAELVANLREIGYPGCIHLRSGFISPGELGIYQKAAVGYVLTNLVEGPSFLDDVQTLTFAAPANAACFSILQFKA